MLYKIKITYLKETKNQSTEPYIIELNTDRIEWSMQQYQRNRPALVWEIVDQK